MLDELILGGEIQETSKKNVLKSIQAQDLLQEVRKKNTNDDHRDVFHRKQTWDIKCLTCHYLTVEETCRDQTTTMTIYSLNWL